MYINDDSTRLGDCFLVIFDSGDILTISPSHNEFIGPITTMPDLHLVVMGNGIIIEFKGVIEYYFHIGNQALIVKSEFY